MSIQHRFERAAISTQTKQFLFQASGRTFDIVSSIASSEDIFHLFSMHSIDRSGSKDADFSGEFQLKVSISDDEPGCKNVLLCYALARFECKITHLFPLFFGRTLNVDVYRRSVSW